MMMSDVNRWHQPLNLY